MSGVLIPGGETLTLNCLAITVRIPSFTLLCGFPREGHVVRRFMTYLVVLAVGFFTLVGSVGPAVAQQQSRHITPYLHLGEVCRDVKSSVNNRTGVICIMVNEDDIDPLNYQALVSFTAKSGTLTAVNVSHLNFSVDAQTKRSVSFENKTASGQSGFISTNWWATTSGVVDAGVYNACLQWSDGGIACTASSEWWYSTPETI